MHPDRSPTWCHKDSAIVGKRRGFIRAKIEPIFCLVSFSSKNQTLPHVVYGALKRISLTWRVVQYGAYKIVATDYGADPYCVTCLPCLALPYTIIFSASCCFPFSSMLLLEIFGRPFFMDDFCTFFSMSLGLFTGTSIY